MLEAKQISPCHFLQGDGSIIVLDDSSAASFCVILCPGLVIKGVETWANNTSQMTPQLLSRDRHVS